MTVDVTSATVAIKNAGAVNVRVTPMPGQSITEGDYQIEIKNGQNWSTVMTGVKKVIAEQIVAQALNRVICG
jgi:hypothetical protein